MSLLAEAFMQTLYLAIGAFVLASWVILATWLLYDFLTRPHPIPVWGLTVPFIADEDGGEER